MKRLVLGVALLSIGVNLALLTYHALFLQWGVSGMLVHYAHQVFAPLLGAAGGGLIGGRLYTARGAMIDDE